ncbi:hypothetical protein HOC80_01630 [archaeon]|jgi:hypothetical protein|nr:hypothetical protein [archaeon]MBT4416782.1 hypothetical protein [archaeon]
MEDKYRLTEENIKGALEVIKRFQEYDYKIDPDLVFEILQRRPDQPPVMGRGCYFQPITLKGGIEGKLYFVRRSVEDGFADYVITVQYYSPDHDVEVELVREGYPANYLFGM